MQVISLLEALIVENICPIRSPATGTITFLEEIRQDLTDVHWSIQEGEPMAWDVAVPSSSLSSCPHPATLGLQEFSDFGPHPTSWHKSKYIRCSGHTDVTNHAHFAFLDTYGARLVDNVLEVVVADPGFRVKSGSTTSTLSMYYEASSYGLGLNDSAGLAPPLHVKAVSPSEMRNVVRREEHSGGCYCDILLPERVYMALGLIYYPQYGHTIFNGLSNLMATMWRKQLRAGSGAGVGENVVFSPYLRRNTTSSAEDVPHTQYMIQWHDMYDELFGALVDEIVPWERILDASMKGVKVCFNRLLVGALPHMDHLNVTVPDHMWDRFSRWLISFLFKNEITGYLGKEFNPRIETISQEQLMNFNPFQPHSRGKSDCSVTFVVRRIRSNSEEAIFERESRDIANLAALVTEAEDMGCSVQTLLLQHMNMKDQVAQVRWNTTLLVGADGTGLLNAVHMNECSTVLRVEMWRKPGIVARLGPARWVDYRPTLSETVWFNSSHPIAQYLNSVHPMERLETMSLGESPFPDHEVEYFLREYQATTVNVTEFRSVVDSSIKYHRACSVPM